MYGHNFEFFVIFYQFFKKNFIIFWIFCNFSPSSQRHQTSDQILAQPCIIRCRFHLVVGRGFKLAHPILLDDHKTLRERRLNEPDCEAGAIDHPSAFSCSIYTAASQDDATLESDEQCNQRIESLTYREKYTSCWCECQNLRACQVSAEARRWE